MREMRLQTWVGAAAIAVRVIAAALLVFGPWTNEASELDGWDVDRFQQIADAPGTAYVDHDVEYPPLTVAVAEVVLADDVVSSHRRLVAISLVVDLAVAAVLARHWGRGVAVAYLVLSLPLIPGGLLRLDLWASLAAVGAVATITPRPGSGIDRRGTAVRDALFAVATVIGALIKLWPALLIAAAVGLRRQRAAVLAAVGGLVSGIVWLALVGPEAIQQITSLRGVTGWHLESIPGTLVALFTDEAPRREADAFRIGQLNDTVVLVGRIATMAVTLLAAWLARRSRRGPDERAALVMLAATSALIVTAPLVSPQFLLWLTPWAAIHYRDHLLAGLTMAAVILTGVTLAAFGPPHLDHPVAAAGLLLRNATMVAMVVVALKRLATPEPFAHSDGLEHP